MGMTVTGRVVVVGRIGRGRRWCLWQSCSGGQVRQRKKVVRVASILYGICIKILSTFAQSRLNLR